MKRFLHIISECLAASLLCAAAVPAVSAQTPDDGGKTYAVGGMVLDENNTPLVGVSVVDKENVGNGTLTGADGKYTIKVSGSSVLEFSYLGYTTVYRNVDNRTVVDAVLKPSNVDIQDVVVIGYGTTTKADMTGAVTSVDMAALSEAPVLSVGEALQGRVAGADIVSTTGEPGAETSIQIRGSRSISAGNEPLIVVDGVADAVQSLNDINPSDIKSISVLKDASSTAIYGSRGANGVIIITTESSVPSNFTATFRASVGVSYLATKLDLMDASEFAAWRNEIAYWSAGLDGKPQQAGSQYYFIDPSKLGKGTDWVDALSQTAVYQNYSLSVAGGTKRTKLQASFGYDDQKGIIINTGLQRYTGRLGVNSQVTKWLQIGANVNYVYRNSDKNSAAISGTNTNAAIFLSPLLSIGDTWNIYGDSAKSGGSIFDNPYICARNIVNDETASNMNIVPFVNIKFHKNLTLRSKLSYTLHDQKSFYYSPSYMPVAAADVSGGTARRAQYLRQSLLSETTLTYKKLFKRKHNFEAMAGYTAESVRTDYQSLQGSGYMNDAVTWHSMGSLYDTRTLLPYTYTNEMLRMAVLTRVNYSYDKRYYFTFTGRIDGSSVFSVGNKWGFFPAGAFRWTISNERFMRGVKWIDDLSLRLSGGRSGNDAVSSYMSLATLGTGQGWLFNDNRYIVYYPNKLANSNLTWETTDSYNIGLNFAVLRNRVVLEAEFYQTFTSDLLLSMKNSQTTGYDNYYTNIGSTRNTGVEITLTTRNIVKPKFGWTTTLTLAHNKQEVADVGNGGEWVPTFTNPRNTSQFLYAYKNGYPANALWGYQYAGVWHNETEIARNQNTHAYASAATPTPGYAKYVDVNNDGKIDQDDVIYLGCSDPVLYGGFQNTFTICRNLTVGIYFSYSLGGSIYNLSELYIGGSSSSWNKYRYLRDAWHPVRNPNSNIPRAYSDDQLGSSRFVHDASFLRLKSVSISYRFDLYNKTKFVRNIRIGISGENLFLWKRYNGFDPDVSTESVARRIDNGAYPKARTFMFNFSITY
ncbi:MAG: TonB-dependent receptor [Alistipes sp.]|nr:TonB-dependent receptor [Alistipes sp.]